MHGVPVALSLPPPSLHRGRARRLAPRSLPPHVTRPVSSLQRRHVSISKDCSRILPSPRPRSRWPVLDRRLPPPALPPLSPLSLLLSLSPPRLQPANGLHQGGGCERRPRRALLPPRALHTCTTTRFLRAAAPAVPRAAHFSGGGAPAESREGAVHRPSFKFSLETRRTGSSSFRTAAATTRALRPPPTRQCAPRLRRLRRAALLCAAAVPVLAPCAPSRMKVRLAGRAGRRAAWREGRARGGRGTGRRGERGGGRGEEACD